MCVVRANDRFVATRLWARGAPPFTDLTFFDASQRSPGVKDRFVADENIKELQDKVTRLVEGKFGGDWDRAFAHYASTKGAPGILDRDELMQVLEDAGIGSWVTRGLWADGVIKELDTSRDRSISHEEFRTMLRVGR
jgi:hypothetical protein